MIVKDKIYKQKIINVLSLSFDDNPSINFVAKQDKHRKRRIRDMMDYCFEVCLERGIVFISEDNSACALILKSETNMHWIKSVQLDLKFAIQCVGLSRVFKVLKRENLINASHPNEDFYHLWLIGVDPAEQGKGKGAAILTEALIHCDKNPRPIYLETSVERNISWYKRFGFENRTVLDIGDGLYQMIRK